MGNSNIGNPLTISERIINNKDLSSFIISAVLTTIYAIAYKQYFFIDWVHYIFVNLLVLVSSFATS
jgi:hypothetical protein